MKVLMIFTGGTIASQLNGASISPVEKSCDIKSRLIEKFFDNYPQFQGNIDFECEFLLNKLSENMKLSDWDRILRYLLSADLNLFDAVFIAHGSDTLAYFANMLSIFFGKSKTPIFIIASDKVIDDPTANGLINLKSAAEYSLKGNLSGVYVPYKNQDQLIILHKGYQITQSQILGNDFYSLPSKPVYSDEFHGFYKNVLILKSYVGADYSYINTNGVDSVLIELYHGATADFENLSEFTKKARSKNTKVFAASIISGTDIYETTQKLKESGVQFLYDITLETAYAALASDIL